MTAADIRRRSAISGCRPREMPARPQPTPQLTMPTCTQRAAVAAKQRAARVALAAVLAAAVGVAGADHVRGDEPVALPAVELAAAAVGDERHLDLAQVTLLGREPSRVDAPADHGQRAVVQTAAVAARPRAARRPGPAGSRPSRRPVDVGRSQAPGGPRCCARRTRCRAEVAGAGGHEDRRGAAGLADAVGRGQHVLGADQGAGTAVGEPYHPRELVATGASHRRPPRSRRVVRPGAGVRNARHREQQDQHHRHSPQVTDATP